MENKELFSLLEETLDGSSKSKDILNVLNIISNSNNNIREPINDEEKTTFNGIKACLPYLDEDKQKRFNLFIKTMEIQKIIEQYKQTDYRKKPEENWRYGMLQAAKPYLNENNSKKMDLLMKILTLKDISDKQI